MNGLEVQRWIPGVIFEERVGFFSDKLDFFRQFAVVLPESLCGF